ncbi:hypothetical protein RR46_00779 [Papilio xuthus]|uniref:Uncharacterized protein n=1 Tax=Papilio xuthus TaxID=66420 RepID=A0A0N0P9Z9_PAPXU|nr:hypothetical protein RR46_00779 [Papilio xuthus]
MMDIIYKATMRRDENGTYAPFRPEDQFVYADVDLKDYGPINYKAASIYAQMKKVKEQQKMQEVYDKQTDDDML